MQLKRSPLALQGTSRGKHAVSRRRSVLSKFYRYKYVLPVTRKLERSNFVIAPSDNHKKHEFRPMPMMVVPTHNYCPPDYQQHTDDDNIGGTCNSNSNIYSSSSASVGARSQSKSIPTSTQKDGDDKEGTINRKTSCSDIKTEETTIFRQLGILKRGGYWKHLPREEQEQDQEEHEEGMLPDERWRNNSMGSLVGNKDENKENLIRYLNHPNVMRTVAEFNEDDVEADDDTIATEIDDMDDDDCLHDSNSDPFSEYVLTRTDRIGCNANSGSIGSLCKGFYIHAITEDGWMCSNNCFHNSDIATDSNSYDEVLRGELKGEDNDKDKESRLKFQQLASSSSSSSPSLSSSSPLILLRLPNKVAALGREKMHVQEIGLVKRRDNGTVEPCNYYLNSDGDVIIHSASEQLYGRILL